MYRSLAFFIITASCFFVIPAISIREDECSLAEDKDDVNVTMHIFKNSSEEWISSFQAEKTISNSTTGLIVNLKHSVVKCGPKYLVRVEGILRADKHTNELPPNAKELPPNAKELPPSATKLPPNENELITTTDSWEPTTLNNHEDFDGKLKFRQSKGNHVVLSNDQRAASRINPNSAPGNAGVVTNRPLKDGELFQVQIDEVTHHFDVGGLYIGVVQEPPIDIEYRNCVCKIEDGVWVLYRGNIKLGQQILQHDYPLTGMNLKVNDRIGVKRNINSSLHFFLNGKDMGQAAEDVPPNVYGFVDVANYVVKISIVD